MNVSFPAPVATGTTYTAIVCFKLMPEFPAKALPKNADI
jgi:hypothetical protein